MVDLGPSLPGPPNNMGPGCSPSESVLSADHPLYGREARSHAGWWLVCDKLRLMWAATLDEANAVAEALKGELRPGKGRRRGPVVWKALYARVEAFGGAPVVVMFDYSDDAVLGELRVEFSPANQSQYGVAFVRDRIGDVGLPWASAHVERFDAAYDRLDDPYAYELDSANGHRFNRYGATSRGAQTIAHGGKRSDVFGIQRYDKSAERRVKAGIEVGSDLLRVEVMRRPRDGDPWACRLRDLACVPFPMADGFRVFRAVRPHDEYRDQRYRALACVSMVDGPAAARGAARDVLSSHQVARWEYCHWQDVGDELAESFDVVWPRVCGSILGLAS